MSPLYQQKFKTHLRVYAIISKRLSQMRVYRFLHTSRDFGIISPPARVLEHPSAFITPWRHSPAVGACIFMPFPQLRCFHNCCPSREKRSNHTLLKNLQGGYFDPYELICTMLRQTGDFVSQTGYI
jgi:hypothetical protein